MVTKAVYLAGPISGLSYEESTGWRDEVTAALRSSNIAAISPLRAKVYLRETGAIKDSYTDKDLNDNTFVNMSTERGITSRDRFDCTNCGVVLVNMLGTKRVSIGTCMEVAWADLERIPVVLVMEKEGNPHDHAMIRDCVAYRVDNLADAVKIVRAILGDY
jgi:nucleoside 2-deoxyribosyltransferase